MYGDFSSPLYNPNINPYMYAQTPYQQQPKQDVIKVNGENGARAFPIGANSSALLLDSSGELVWLVTTDGAGYKTVMPYDISPHQATPTPDFTTLEQRIERLEGIINGNSSDTSTARREQPEYCRNTEPRKDYKRLEEPTSIPRTNDVREEPTNGAGYGVRQAERWKPENSL